MAESLAIKFLRDNSREELPQGHQDVQTPPHGDQVEHALQNELEVLLQRQTALAEQRTKALEAKFTKLNKNMQTARERARVSLTAFVHATVVLRQETEKLDVVIEELNDGLERIDDAVKLAANGKH